MVGSLGPGARWDKVDPAHTLVHALEEMGEVARLVLGWEGYKDVESPEKLRADLEEEMSDLFVFLFKLAYQTGIDVEDALGRGQARPTAVTLTWSRPDKSWPAIMPGRQRLNKICDV